MDELAGLTEEERSLAMERFRLDLSSVQVPDTKHLGAYRRIGQFRPSALMATDVAEEAWPFNVPTSLPVMGFHTSMVPLLPPETAERPSALTATDVT
jgi:hypothetical protein